MADIADQSDSIIDAARVAAIETARRGPFHAFKSVGVCLWCGDPVSPGRTHCRPRDNDCEVDHLKAIRFRQGH